MSEHEPAALKDTDAGTSAECQEAGLLENFSFFPKPDATAQLFGLAPLSQSLPDTFAEMVNCYEELLCDVTERAGHGLEPHVSETLRIMSQELGILKAGPRDVIDIHVTAIKHRLNEVPKDRAGVYVQKSRLSVLEFMGYLAAYYRNYAYMPERYKQNSNDIPAMLAGNSDEEK
ncbi:MAG: hypothetical protein SFH39_08535 [Candidatus Magnetobacterium sp. LHC-1]|nr:hypothetical protein [Nitrospirota bacterium]